MNILPFRGYRYNLAKITQLDDVISPPYDQFKEGLDDLLCNRHPYNIAHIIMNKESPSDTPADNRYMRSKTLLEQWIRSQIFIQDLRPAIYPYFQDYEVRGFGTKTRKGFVALGEVTEYSQRIVLPHEQTLSKPKQDRLNLLRAALADSGLVFMLYSDPEGRIESILDALTSCQPDMMAMDLNQDLNRLWRIDDVSVIQKVQERMASKKVIIADGHHRYEVALAFRHETVSRVKEDPRWDLYRHKLMSFVRLESEGITILPIHRLVHRVKGFEAIAFKERLGEFFTLEEFQISPGNQFSLLENLVAGLKKQQALGANAFGLYLTSLKKYMLLTFKKEVSDKVAWPTDKSPSWRKLDVSILQVVVLGHLLGIGDEELEQQTNIEYVSEHAEAVRMADAKQYQCTLLLNPTPIEHVKEVVEAGDLLPQKSTHFHPKLMEGLVFAKHL